MEQLEMIKAFAELEGVEGLEHKGRFIKGCEFNAVINLIKGSRLTDIELAAFLDSAAYNPITDLALNCAARDKYEVEVNYSAFTVTDFCNDNLDITRVHFKCKSDVPAVIIECILKSKGLYK